VLAHVLEEQLALARTLEALADVKVENAERPHLGVIRIRLASKKELAVAHANQPTHRAPLDGEEEPVVAGQHLRVGGDRLAQALGLHRSDAGGVDGVAEQPRVRRVELPEKFARHDQHARADRPWELALHARQARTAPQIENAEPNRAVPKKRRCERLAVL